jgi:hypothetical protein
VPHTVKKGKGKGKSKKRASVGAVAVKPKKVKSAAANARDETRATWWKDKLAKKENKKDKKEKKATQSVATSEPTLVKQEAPVEVAAKASPGTAVPVAAAQGPEPKLKRDSSPAGSGCSKASSSRSSRSGASKKGGSASSSGSSHGSKKKSAKASGQATNAAPAVPALAPAAPAMAAWQNQARATWDAVSYMEHLLTPRQVCELHAATVALNSSITSGVVGREALKTMGLGFIQIATSVPRGPDAASA